MQRDGHRILRQLVHVAFQLAEDADDAVGSVVQGRQHLYAVEFFEINDEGRLCETGFPSARNPRSITARHSAYRQHSLAAPRSQVDKLGPGRDL